MTRRRAAADRSVGARQRQVRRFRPSRRNWLAARFLQRSFSAQLEASCALFMRSRKADLATRDLARPAIRRVLTEILVHFPVYRIYAGVEHASPPDAFVSVAGGRGREDDMPAERPVADRNPRPVARGNAHPLRGGCAANNRPCPIPAIERGALRESGGGHRLLSLRPAPVAQRRRLRPPSVQLRLRRIPPPHAGAGDRFSAFHACDRHARPQTRRGRARAARRLERTGRRMDAGRRAMDRALRFRIVRRLTVRRCRARAISRFCCKQSSAPGRRDCSRQTTSRLAAYGNALLHGSRKPARSQAVQRLVGAERELRTRRQRTRRLAFCRTVRTVDGDCRLRLAHSTGRRCQRPRASCC